MDAEQATQVGDKPFALTAAIRNMEIAYRPGSSKYDRYIHIINKLLFQSGDDHTLGEAQGQVLLPESCCESYSPKSVRVTDTYLASLLVSALKNE